jgi:outer membrane autotransporter protein
MSIFKPCILAAALLIPSHGFSQNRHKSNFHIEGFSVKTDVLTLMNTAISKSLNGYYISGELYFNNEYSINADMSTTSESQPGYYRKEKRWGSHVRWYFMQDDCNCSALFGGIYFSSVSRTETVSRYLPNNAIKTVNYDKSSFEGGLCGGYEAILADHFVIDPSVQLGLGFYSDSQNTETINGMYDAPDTGLILVKIMLAVGYRF